MADPNTQNQMHMKKKRLLQGPEFPPIANMTDSINFKDISKEEAR